MYAINHGLPGIGFVLTPELAITAIDIDDCVDQETGEIAAWAQPHIDRFDTYWEYSPTKTGVRGLLFGDLPPGGRRRGKIEVYNSGRYVTITGHALDGEIKPIADCTNELAAWHVETFPAPKPTSAPSIAAPPRTAEDDEILTQAMRAKHGEEFRRLWEGDCSQHNNDHSAADLALCNLLRFWCGPDPERIDRLFRQSGLYRAKWEREDYRTWTITKALPGDVYRPPAPIKASSHSAPASSIPGPVPIEPPAVPETSLESCNMRLAQALQRVAELEAEKADLQAHLVAEQERSQQLREQLKAKEQVISRAAGIRRNKNLKSYKDTAAALVYELAAKEGKAGDDGFIEISLPALADSAGRSTDTVGRDIKRFAEVGLIEKQTRRIMIERVNQETGEVIRSPEPRVFIKPPGESKIIDLTERFAAADMRTVRKVEERRCPACNENSGTVVTITEHCASCGVEVAPPRKEYRKPHVITEEEMTTERKPHSAVYEHSPPSVVNGSLQPQSAVYGSPASPASGKPQPAAYRPPEHLDDLAKRLRESPLLNERVFS